MRYLFSVVVVTFLCGTAQGFGAAQPAQEVERLFAQLQNPATSGQASVQLKTLAESNAKATQYLTEKLPALIANTSLDPVARRDSIRLAGNLRIAEAVPILVELLDSSPEGGSTTIAQSMRLDTDPVGKALAEIGEPAIAAVRKVLENDSSEPSMRMRAALILSNMNSGNADQVLTLRLQNERDPRVKGVIQSRLREHAQKTIH